MFVDGRSVEENSLVETDVCIIGGGVAGLSLARELSKESFQVCVLEAGGLSLEPASQDLCAGENAGHRYFPLHEARARIFGGTSNFWNIFTRDRGLTARVRPLDPLDFEERDWVPHSGWPLTFEDLRPYYNRAQSLLEVDPPGFEPEQWTGPAGGEKEREHLHGETFETIVYKFCSQEVFTNRLRVDLQYDVDSVLVFLFANAVEIETDETGGRATRVRVACLEGPRFWMAAKLFILAAGGIENPRLMLASRGVQQRGLGNAHDLVGRFFMEHLHFWSGVWVPPSRDLLDSISSYLEIHTVHGVPVLEKLALKASVQRESRLLNQNVQLIPRKISPAALFPRPAHSGLRSSAVAFYRSLRRSVARRRRKEAINVLRLANMSEQVPNPDSRVTLMEETDALGLNKVRLDWKVTPLDIESVRRTQKILAAEVRRQGLGRLFIHLNRRTLPGDLHGGYHHMGTTRMHLDPRHGVVDPDCRVHGVSNLFVAGPSTFPTGGYANPVLTIVALSLRLADHIKEIMEASAIGVVDRSGEEMANVGGIESTER